MTVRIGTSGWSYNHWKHSFYPPKLPKNKWLAYLASTFDTVEINATFYRQPKPETFEKWYAQTPDKFHFSIKANRFITHIKKLSGTRDSMIRFYTALSPLKEKIGAILFQFPPSLRFEPETVRQFLSQIDDRFHTTIEVRNPSFFTKDFYNLLKEYRCALCWSDTGGRYPYEEVITADFLYIRLHGSPLLYRSSYSEEFLTTLGQKIIDSGLDAFIYFDNDAEGYAPKNALWLKKFIESKSAI